MRKWWAIAATLVLGSLALIGSVVTAQTGGVVGNPTFSCASTSTVMCSSAPDSFTTLTPANAATPQESPISPWVVTQNSVDLVYGSVSNPYWQPPPGGGNSIDLNGTGYPADGAIQQTLATEKGSGYVVSFEFSGNFNSATCPGGSTQTMTVVASGNSSSSFTFTEPSQYSYQAMGWESKTYSFTATGTSTTLTFTADSTNKTNCGPVLGDVTATPASSCESGSCTLNLQSSTTGTAGSISASSNQGFVLEATFNSGDLLSCDSAVTGKATADPLLVQSYSGPDVVHGSVTLTFPKAVVHEVPTNKGTPHMPVCVGANQRFPGSTETQPTSTSPFSYQGLLYACASSVYQADLTNSTTYPLHVCVFSYARVHGAEKVVIETSSFGDPMFW